MARDPRVDPRPGDRVRSESTWETWTVKEILLSDNHLREYVECHVDIPADSPYITNPKPGREERKRLRLSEWKAWAQDRSCFYVAD